MTPAKDQDAEGIESMQCALINFNNLLKNMPALSEHPYFKIAYFQLKWGLWSCGRHEGPEPELK